MLSSARWIATLNVKALSLRMCSRCSAIVRTFARDFGLMPMVGGRCQSNTLFILGLHALVFPINGLFQPYPRAIKLHQIPQLGKVYAREAYGTCFGFDFLFHAPLLITIVQQVNNFILWRFQKDLLKCLDRLCNSDDTKPNRKQTATNPTGESR